jgi:uncharacterized membrane protein (GlpM family)
MVHILKRKQRMEQDPFVAEESFKRVSNRVKPWTTVILTVFLVVVAVHIAAGMTPLTWAYIMLILLTVSATNQIMLINVIPLESTIAFAVHEYLLRERVSRQLLLQLVQQLWEVLQVHQQLQPMMLLHQQQRLLILRVEWLMEWPRGHQLLG